METVLMYIQEAFMWAGVIVTAGTSICVALEKVAAITPTTKDDIAISKVKAFLSKTAALLDRVSIYTFKK